MTIPTSDVPVPAAVSRLAHGLYIDAVWVNDVGGATFRLLDPWRTDQFIKWLPHGTSESLAREAMRLRWAKRYTVAPPVIEYGTDADGEWLVTNALPGTSAVDPRWLTRPEDAVRAIGRGLRALHNRMPVASCTYSWSVDDRIARARQAGREVPSELEKAPEVDQLVVCHGDACAPNTLLSDDGAWVGHVDFGSLGVADRWADLAVASWSTDWNYGRDYTGLLLEAYGVEADEERIEYYRRLWDAT